MGDSDIRAGPMQPSSYWTRLSESLLRLGQATRISRGLTQPSSHWTRMPSHRPGRSPRRSPDSRPHPAIPARLPGHVHAPVFGDAVPSRLACPRSQRSLRTAYPSLLSGSLSESLSESTIRVRLFGSDKRIGEAAPGAQQPAGPEIRFAIRVAVRVACDRRSAPQPAPSESRRQ